MNKKLFALILSISLIFSAGTTFAKIDRVEVNQGIGSYIDKTTGEIKEITNFVSEKNTVILVELDEEIEINQATQKVEIIKDGAVIATLLPNGSGNTTLLEFLPKSIDEVKGWTSGTYEIKATIGEWTATKTATFKSTQALNILVVPVKANYAGEIKSCTGLYKTARTFLEQTYPVAEKNINWVIGRELDCSEEQYDLKTDPGCYNVWDALKNLQAKDKNNKDTYDLILGFVPDRQGAESNLQGFTYGKPANIITESDEDMQATVSHEIAHCYKVGDEYSGGSFNPEVNDPPLGMEGRDFNTGEGSVIGKNPVFVGDESLGEGSLINPLARPYEFGGRGVIKNPTVSYMGSGGAQANYWTTPTIYEYLYNKLLVEEKNTSEEELINLVEVYGVINKNGTVETDPLYTFPGYKSDIENVGDYTFAAVDANGAVLSSNNFDANFYNPSMNETSEYAPFELYAQFPAGTAKFVISKAGKELHQISVSPNAPNGAFSENPNVFKGEQTFKWTATDSDNDKIVSQILYSPDGEELYVLENDYEETEITVDFEGLEGNENAYIWIVLSDGVNSFNLFTDIESEEASDKEQPSEWAVEELDLATKANLTYKEILSKYQKNITRQEFCKLVVNFYTAMGGKLPETPKSPFSDTTDENVLIANKLGIVNGISATEFSPNADITREQIAAMMLRAVKLFSTPSITDNLNKFDDYDDISDWAIESLAYFNEKGIIKGLSETTIASKNNTTREQAIIIVYRTFESMAPETDVIPEEEVQTPEKEVTVPKEPSEKTEETVASGLYTLTAKSNDNRCIAVRRSDMKNGAEVIISPIYNIDDQRFYFEEKDGKYRLKAKHSGKYLTIDKEQKSGAYITQSDVIDDELQLFELIDCGGDFVKLKTSNDLYLTPKDGSLKSVTRIIICEEDDNLNQIFKLTEVK